jgi:hypothetical protein
MSRVVHGMIDSVLQGPTVDITLKRMPTSAISDRRKMFELFSHLKVGTGLRAGVSTPFFWQTHGFKGVRLMIMHMRAKCITVKCQF